MRDMNAIRHQIAEHEPYVGVFLKRVEHHNQSVDQLQHIHPVGTFAHLLEAKDYGDRMTVAVRAVRRILATGVHQLAHGPQPTSCRVSVDNLQHEAFVHTAIVRATTHEIVRTIRDMAARRSLPVELLRQLEQEDQYVIQDTLYVCDLGAVCAAGATPAELQAVLAERNIPRRLLATLHLLKRELENEQMQRRIGEEVEANVRQMHRKFMLLERVKVIKKELGLSKLNDREADRMEARLVGREIPAEVRAIVDEEIRRLRATPDGSADFNGLRNYLDWLTTMPWGQRTAENLNIREARQVLDGEHFGMVEVKQRILEFIAVSQLKGSTQGKILCFHGPPGVGKTSIARSIARALNRKYFRFSVSGMHSAAEVKGHRRTYVGAMPGKLVQCLKTTGVENPLVLIDEIDKIGVAGQAMGVVNNNAGLTGDPAAALLELLDPKQNASFMDFYLDVPVDLSRVLFICTANYVDNIAPVLADRMELIEMSGYEDAEKCAIAKQYLIPRALNEAGMSERMLRFEPAALELLMQHYCAESGVRQLQRLIEKVVRKVAYQVVTKIQPASQVLVINDLRLAEYLGKSTNPTERLFAAEETQPPGVVMGLGMAHHGGTVIYVETTSTPLMRGGGRIQALQLTGNLGSVMRESAEIALTVARNTLEDPRYLDEHCVHVHVPMGAQPKDGASAGVTIVAALQSLAMQRPVRSDLALTGELTLNGKVLAVGGIREKTLAARRLGVRCVILPADNRWDYEGLPDGVKNGLEVHFVEEYADVSRIIFD